MSVFENISEIVSKVVENHVGTSAGEHGYYGGR